MKKEKHLGTCISEGLSCPAANSTVLAGPHWQVTSNKAQTELPLCRIVLDLHPDFRL